MQTFLPYSSFSDSAACLDMKRLGKQRVECIQILNALSGKSKKGWKNHPCTNMWRGYEQHLINYGVAICKEWRVRGYKCTCLEKLELFRPLFANSDLPAWLGNKPLHLSHQSNLIRKFPEYYTRFFPNVRNDIPYIWPNSCQ